MCLWSCCWTGCASGLPGGEIAEGQPADLTVLDLDDPHVISAADFRSLGKATPFDGWGVSAGIYMTLCGGNLVYVHEKEDM